MHPLDVQQRKWIYRPGAAPRAPRQIAEPELWIAHRTPPARLHALWLAAPRPDAPLLLYLHGLRCTLGANLERMRSLNALGFGVVGIDYRGFGRSTPALPSEHSVVDDARTAWQWLARRHPRAQRFVFGHSLGGAVAVQLAAEVDDAAGVIVEGTFTSLPDVYRTLRWGWLPLAPWITQRFESAEHVQRLRAPLLVVHGSADRSVPPRLGRALFERASVAKRFVLVPGGSHHDSHALGAAQYRAALADLFGLNTHSLQV